MPHTDASSAFAAEHAAWHERVEAQRTAPHGPLSVSALHWLDASPTRLPELPGVWSAAPDGTVALRVDANDGVRRNGEVIDGSAAIGPLAGIESETLEWGDWRIQVAARGGRIAVRPQNPKSQDRVGYAGTATFPANPAWVVAGRFEPSPREAVEVDSAVPGSKQHYDSPGRAIFEVDGQEFSLTLFGDPGASELRALFADRTGEDLTYPAVRFAPVARHDDGTLSIDFNRATNPPCAYSAHATCPFPPPENRLPVRIEAGELRPGVAL